MAMIVCDKCLHIDHEKYGRFRNRFDFILFDPDLPDFGLALCCICHPLTYRSGRAAKPYCKEITPGVWHDIFKRELAMIEDIKDGVFINRLVSDPIQLNPELIRSRSMFKRIPYAK